MAEHGAEHFRRRVAEATPVDSGNARAAWQTKPVEGPLTSPSEEVYTSGVETFDAVARLLE